MPTPELGSPAPGFELRDQHGATVSLASCAGRAVALVFYPFAFSGVCTGELHDVRDRLAELEATGATVLAVSCDPVYALRAFADRDDLAFSLLSDFWPHGEVARAYGVLDDQRGCAHRSTFVVDGSGVLRWQVHSPMSEARDLDDLIRVLTEPGERPARH